MVHDRQKPCRRLAGEHLCFDLERVRAQSSLGSHLCTCTDYDSDNSYAEHLITEDEFAALPPAMQDRVRRTAANRLQGPGPRYMGWSADPSYTGHCRRIGVCRHLTLIFRRLLTFRFVLDLLRENVFFDGLEQDDGCAQARLGFAAPNVMIMLLT